MVQRKNQVDHEDFMFEEEYDSTFKKASDESDNALLFIGASAGLLAIINSLDSLSPSEMEVVMAEAGETSAEAMGSIDYITSTLPESLPALEEAVTLTPTELAHLNMMMEEAKQYGRMIDPKTVENIAFQNQSRIADQMGMFGGTEAEKQGELSAYYNESVLIPWVPVGDANTCEDCLALEANGPYRPDEYPEPPHYGCRCWPGDPIIVLPGEIAKSVFSKIKQTSQKIYNAIFNRRR
ncbi:hypothetical protein [Methanobacterium ferruginis]|uniref:hypothetical protein n=1 Tax=Methanobacterium ferruginis TaxID=710191 RepID=UPI0025723A52|nr:hypothetical protein [Methanobacterium ferruginis]BDZ68589.1 hypothetical protein GCM10025860_20370 [Methanobacterium ferruginis]